MFNQTGRMPPSVCDLCSKEYTYIIITNSLLVKLVKYVNQGSIKDEYANSVSRQFYFEIAEYLKMWLFFTH